MTDEPPQDQPSSGKPQNAEGDFISGEELDEALTQASSLAAELSEEIGRAEGEPDSSKAQEAPPGANLPQKLDAELDELQQLVSTASSEFDAGGDPDRKHIADTASQTKVADSSSESDEPESKPAGPKVPDFMAEFTQSDKPAESLPSSDDAPGTREHGSRTASHAESSGAAAAGEAGVPVRPGVVGSGLIGVVNARPPASSGEEEPSLPGASEEPAEAVQASTQEGESTDPRSKTKTRLTTLAAFVCHRAVRLLELIDRPVAGVVGDSVRRIAGWVAIATLGTSVLVYILSLF